MLWETTVRVNSEKQTLILAGEVVPQRNSPRPLTIVATPADITPLLAQGENASETFGNAQETLLHPAPASQSYRNIFHGAAGAYARTQALAGGNSRTAIIDTYA
jgi:hypothetical protein